MIIRDRKEREAAAGRVPTNHENRPMLAKGPEEVALYYNSEEEWVPLPKYPARLAKEGTFQPGTATLQGGIKFGRF